MGANENVRVIAKSPWNNAPGTTECCRHQPDVDETNHWNCRLSLGTVEWQQTWLTTDCDQRHSDDAVLQSMPHVNTVVNVRWDCPKNASGYTFFTFTDMETTHGESFRRSISISGAGITTTSYQMIDAG